MQKRSVLAALTLLGAASVLAATGAPAAAATIRCQPDEVAVLPNRIHIRCEAAVGGVSYYAVPVADAPHAARMLSLLSTALVAGRTLVLTYEPSDTSGETLGCSASNCRLLHGAAFGK